jgi:hypothetical protein
LRVFDSRDSLLGTSSLGWLPVEVVVVFEMDVLEESLYLEGDASPIEEFGGSSEDVEDDRDFFFGS